MMRDHSSLSRLDSFPYRHRLSEVMASPVLTGDGDLSLAAACARMDEAKVSSLVVVNPDGVAIGILTERDVLRALARAQAGALDMRVSDVMSAPLQTVSGESYLFVGLARMTRLGLRHLVVADPQGHPLGMITGRALLRTRAGDALAIGDDVAQAQTATDMERAKNALPGLAQSLLKEGVSARNIAGVISTVLRDMTTRAAELALDSLRHDGWGEAPARFALLVLGSGGRGESLLTFDQDNAIVHDGTPADDPWFAELGKRLNDILHEAGIPYCDGEVMARNPFWRRSLDEWKSEIRSWVFEPQMQTVMNVDIFFDFVPVYGDLDLARELKEFSVETAGASAFFCQFLAMNVQQMEVPLGIFGEFVTTHGRLNAKKFGLLPLVSGARAKAVRNALSVTATGERYGTLAERGLMHADDLMTLNEAHETLLSVMLDQQLADLAAGVSPSARIEPRKLPRPQQKRLKAAFKRIRLLKNSMAMG